MNENSQPAYKELIVWQRSIDFACDIIDLIDTIESNRKHYRLVEQLESACTSIPMNIAEGKGRYSKKEFSHFLMIARGSLYETMTLLEIMKIKQWITNESYEKLEQQSQVIGKMINALNRSIKSTH
jgi:four helix bundle protein